MIIIILIPNLVFTELPPEKIEFNKSSSSLLTCEMKAPSDSVVYWTQKQVEMEECQIPNLNKATPNDTSIALCDTIAVVNNTVIEIDKEYSIFHSELQVREICISKSTLTRVCNLHNSSVDCVFHE